MEGKFWHGLVWGSILGTALGAILTPMAKTPKKLMAERSTDAVVDTSRSFMRQARRTRKRLMRKMDL